MATNGRGTKRWEKEEILSHELYNIGHLIEAGVAHYHATGKRTLLNIAIKAADRVCADFGPDKLHTYSGHQIIELAMAKLYKVTGDKKYLETGKFILDVRGPGGDEYNQAHKKVVDQHEAVGHAVGAAYMYAGMADIAALTSDAQYIKAHRRHLGKCRDKENLCNGGHRLHTATARLLAVTLIFPTCRPTTKPVRRLPMCIGTTACSCSHGDAKYYDVLERTLYNAFLSGVLIDGRSFLLSQPVGITRSASAEPVVCLCVLPQQRHAVCAFGGWIFLCSKRNVDLCEPVRSKARSTLQWIRIW